jgi:GTP-binding protein
VGRSNVGKSSLINAVAKQNKLAHTSKTPGRTRLLNMFEVASGGSIVDLPGYGFAKAPANMRRSWQQMIEGYLLDREELRMIVVLVDGEVGPTRLDQQMLDWLRAEQLPHSVVATKHDKVKSAKRQKRKRELAEGCQLEKGDIVWASAAKGVGIDQLRGLIRVWLTP